MLVGLGTLCSLLLACSGPDENEDIQIVQVEDKTGLEINYCLDDEEAIFGDMARNDIEDIIDEILGELAQEPASQARMDQVIEDVFSRYGIMDDLRIKNAKEKIKLGSRGGKK